MNKHQALTLSNYQKLILEHQELKAQYDQLQSLFHMLAASKIEVQLKPQIQKFYERTPETQKILDELYPM